MVVENFESYCFDKAYVVFVDNVSLWWLKFLKPGFRHCYMLFAYDEKRTWIELNPYSNQTFVKVYHFEESFDYIFFLRSHENLNIFETPIFCAPQKCAPMGFFSCVEMVKRILGIHSLSLITPYQLYKKLKVVGKKS